MDAAEQFSDLMTVDDFLRWKAPDNRQWQLIDGEPVAMAPPSVRHGAIQTEVSRQIATHLLELGGRCRLITTPGIVPNAQPDRNCRIPDCAVTCALPETDEKILRDPLLVIEILSLGNQAETWINVWSYTTIPSVREILVLKSDAIEAQLLRRRDDGTWPDRTDIVTDHLSLGSIGFETLVASLYRGTALAEAGAA